MSALRVLGLMMVSSWLVVGCSSAKKIEPGAACLLNTDCNNPMVCSMNKCHDACHGTADCPPGESCVKTARGTVCQLPGEASCSQTACGGSLVCASDLRCRSGCQFPADCASGQVCVSGVCADPTDLDMNGQLPQAGPGPVADAGANLSPDAATKDSGVDLVVAPADAGAKDGGADLAGTEAAGSGPDVLADLAPTKLPDAGADLVAQPDLPAADLAADKLPSTPDVNTGTPDAVSLPEGGGAAPVATGCGVPPVATRYFCDDFESGLSNWVVSGQDWNTTTSTSRSPTHCLTDSPDGNYGNSVDVAIALTRAIDLSGATQPVILFWHKLFLSAEGYTSLVGWGDFAFVEASTDYGTTWREIGHYSAVTVTSWSLQQFSLAAFVGSSIKLRFRLWTNTADVSDGWYIDDVEIREAN
jgi:hypothetical protein